MSREIIVKSKVPTIKEIEKRLPLMKEVAANLYKDSDSLKVWELADGTTIERMKPRSKHEKPVYLRFFEDGSDKEEFHSFEAARKFAKKIRRMEAENRHYDDSLAESSGKEYAEEIYHNLRRAFSKKDLKHQLLLTIRKWDSKESRKEYGTYAYGIVIKLKQHYQKMK